jgi:hypothetical protein
MKIWVGFLILTFIMGGREIRRQRPTRLIVLFGLCVVVMLALRSYRFA